MNEKIKKFFESKTSSRILYVIGLIVVALIIFYAGINVGFHKASFGRAWGENYEHNFGIRSSQPIFDRDNFPNANGAIGKIIKIGLPTIIVRDDKDNTEKVVLIKDDTKIQKMMTNIKPSDLSVDEYVVIIGSPNNLGQIEAKFVRVMPLGMPVPPPSE